MVKILIEDPWNASIWPSNGICEQILVVEDSHCHSLNKESWESLVSSENLSYPKMWKQYSRLEAYKVTKEWMKNICELTKGKEKLRLSWKGTTRLKESVSQ